MWLVLMPRWFLCPVFNSRNRFQSLVIAVTLTLLSLVLPSMVEYIVVPIECRQLFSGHFFVFHPANNKKGERGKKGKRREKKEGGEKENNLQCSAAPV
jgi:hypothetical protein